MRAAFRLAIVAATAAALAASPRAVVADTVTIEATRDATIIEDPAGAFANGAGPGLFIGRTGGYGSRRAVVMFDLTQALPDRAIVEGVRLSLYMASGNAGSRAIRVHRVMSDWGEGASVSGGGGGADSGPGDVTWIHTFWDTGFWDQPGGDFAARASAATEVDAVGLHTWSSTPALVGDVRRWLAAPQRNFGWILIGDEETAQSVKVFASREHPDPMLRPVIEITYRLPGRPGGPAN